MSSHTSIYDDGWIKIYKGEGADRQQIIKIEEANDTDLYDRAREAVISWENSKKERNARRCPDLIADSKQAAAVAADYIDNPVMEFGA